jgi:hypothetical protein
MYALHFDPTTAFRKALPRNFSEFETAELPPHRIDLHIEEPELGLFPDAQCDLMSALVRQCFIDNKNQVSVIMATHSPYILAHLNNMLQAGQTRRRDADKTPPLAPNSTAAYQIANGTCTPLLDEETGLIGDNGIDKCSEKIYEQFDALLDEERHG